jgi:hypothetical protein
MANDVFLAGSNTQEVRAMHRAMHQHRVHANRSNGQRVRQARERLYGKQSHLVVISYVGQK